LRGCVCGGGLRWEEAEAVGEGGEPRVGVGRAENEIVAAWNEDRDLEIMRKGL